MKFMHTPGYEPPPPTDEEIEAGRKWLMRNATSLMRARLKWKKSQFAKLRNATLVHFLCEYVVNNKMCSEPARKFAEELRRRQKESWDRQNKRPPPPTRGHG